MAVQNTIKIAFTNGDIMYLSGVTNYRYNAAEGYFVVEKNGYNQFFPAATVLYMGCKFDLEGAVNGE